MLGYLSSYFGKQIEISILDTFYQDFVSTNV
jgi:hypothetical protein